MRRRTGSRGAEGEAVVSHPCSQNSKGKKVTISWSILQCVHVSYSIQNLQAHFLEEGWVGW